MREILFRGKRLEIGDWVVGSLITFLDGDCYIATAYENPYIMYKRSVDPSTVGQYTGRIDKNGKRVFEGDIIRLRNGIPGYDVGVILWDDNDQAYLIVKGPAEKVMLDDFGNYGRPEYYEVIGNIHDTPELLED